MTTFSDTQLREAIDAGDIIPVFQPVVCTDDGRIAGVEVLARWYRADGSAVPPEAFIARAERCGLILPLTLKLMARVRQLLTAYSPRLPHPFTVGINAGPSCLREPDFTEACRRFSTAFAPNIVQLAVEVTEHEPLTADLIPALTELRVTGAILVLDDYGTGFADVEALDIIRPDIVKLDRSLTRLAGEGDPDGRLSECLALLGRRPEMRVLAEGVETEAERHWLCEKGIHLAQGYYYASPGGLLAVNESMSNTEVKIIAEPFPVGGPGWYL